MKILKKIKKIFIVTNNHAYTYTVGNYYSLKFDEKITSINDISKEYPDKIEFIFEIKYNDKILAEIINVPVIVEYFI